MTSVSSFRTPSLALACQNSLPSHHRSFSSEETSPLPPLLMTMTHPGLQSSLDPRKHRFSSSSHPLTSNRLLSPRISRKFSLNEGNPPPPPIQRRSSLPPPSRARHARRPSLPSSPLLTIPLRPCCPNCFSATESAALQGDNWTERFSRAARRRRSASADNHPCPPHLLADSGATIQWSTVAESTSTTPFLSVLLVDESNHQATPGATDDDAASAGVSDEQGSNAVLNGLDHLSVQDPDDDILLPMLSRHKPWLSPIPSNNPSADDLSPASAAAEDADGLRLCSSPASTSISPPASPLPQTPSSSTFPTPVSSPTISSPTRQRERDASPRISIHSASRKVRRSCVLAQTSSRASAC
jgi:hypothetical protein